MTTPNPYQCHQMGRDPTHRQPIIGVFNGNNTLIKRLDVGTLAAIYHKYRVMLRTLRAIQDAPTLEDARALAQQTLDILE